MPCNPAPLQCQKKIDLLESNGFKRGDISYPDDFTRIRSLANFFHIKTSIPYHEIMNMSYTDLEKAISRINENNDYELNNLKENYIKEMDRNAYE